MTNQQGETGTGGHADSGWDDHAERVLRNEGRLQGLETLVAETREADRKLIEQRSESLARELERRAEALLELVTARADAVLSLSREERNGDRRHVETKMAEGEKRGELALNLLREVYDTAIRQNYEQSREAILALEQRRNAATDKLEQMVRQWRDSDREARELFAEETNRRLDNLNHNNERMAAFQSNSVTRELWQSEKDATMSRESTLRDQITAINLTVLGMTTIEASDKAHREITDRVETSIAASSRILDNKVSGLSEKVDELKAARDTTVGKSQGYAAFYAIALGVITLIVAMAGLAVVLAR